MGVVIIVFPLIIYILAALSVPKNLLQKPDDYFTASKKVGKTAFSSSSIAYAFQVSTIYPFFLWAASKLYFVPFINTLGWGLGILLFLLSFNKWKKFISQDVTMHGFMGETYGKHVRTVASYITIIGFMGFVISETYFGSKVLLSIIDNRNVFYLVIFGSILMIFIYITYGGQLSSLRTDQLQLVISYLGIFGMLVYLSYLIIKNHSTIPYVLWLGLVFLIIYIPIIFYLRKGKFIRLTESNSFKNKAINFSFDLIISILLLTLIILSVYKLFSSKTDFSAGNLFTLTGFGVAGLISLIILPVTFQFVDLTNWQRILAVNADIHNEENLHKKIKNGLLVYAIESPFTWIIFLFFGILVTTAFPSFTFQDLLIDFPRKLIQAHDKTQNFFGYVFILSILSIMLSTIDSFIVGLIYTYAYDINKKSRVIVENKSELSLKMNYQVVTKIGKYFGLVTATITVILFIVFDKTVKNGGELFINLLLAFYSAQLSFFPLIFGKLFLKTHPSERWSIASMVAGAALGIGIGIYSVIWNPDYGWYPIIVCFLTSTIIYFIGIIVSPKINNT